MQCHSVQKRGRNSPFAAHWLPIGCRTLAARCAPSLRVCGQTESRALSTAITPPHTLSGSIFCFSYQFLPIRFCSLRLFRRPLANAKLDRAKLRSLDRPNESSGGQLVAATDNRRRAQIWPPQPARCQGHSVGDQIKAVHANGIKSVNIDHYQAQEARRTHKQRETQTETHSRLSSAHFALHYSCSWLQLFAGKFLNFFVRHFPLSTFQPPDFKFHNSHFTFCSAHFGFHSASCSLFLTPCLCWGAFAARRPPGGQSLAQFPCRLGGIEGEKWREMTKNGRKMGEICSFFSPAFFSSRLFQEASSKGRS